jgi:hypothetical protein
LSILRLNVILGGSFLLHRVKEKNDIPQITQRRKANWMGHIVHENCLLKQAIEGKIAGRGSRRYKLVLYDHNRGELGRGSTRSHTLEYSLWKRLWTCPKTDYMMMMMMMSHKLPD